MTCMCGDTQCPSCGTAQGTLEWQFRDAPEGYTIERNYPTDDDGEQCGDEPYYSVYLTREDDLFLFDAPTETAARDLANDHKRGIRYVNVYLVDRAFGGHEEGGWYYNCGELLRCETHPSEASAELAAKRLEAEYSNDGRRDISSVLSEGRYRVGIEPSRGESYPQKAPRYS